MGIGIVLSKIYFGLPVYASAAKSNLNRVRVVYNDALRTILNVSKMQKMKLSVIRRRLELLLFESTIKPAGVSAVTRSFADALSKDQR